MLAPGHVDADDRDVGRAARRLDRRGQGHGVARVGERDGVGERRLGQQRRRSRSTGTTPMVRAAPARRAAARASEPLLPAPPMTATTGGRPWATYFATTRAVRAGAPQTSMTASASSAGRSPGRRAAMERPKRIGVPVAGHLLAARRPSAPGRPRSRSGVRVSETRVATRSPTARPSGLSGPTSSTVPTSMPPEPVTGFCILPRVRDDLEHLGADGVAVAAVLVGQLTEARGVEVEPLDPRSGPRRARPPGRGPAARRPAAARPAGSSTRCRPTGDDVRRGVVMLTRVRRQILRSRLGKRKNLPYIGDR